MAGYYTLRVIYKKGHLPPASDLRFSSKGDLMAKVKELKERGTAQTLRAYYHAPNEDSVWDWVDIVPVSLEE